MIDKSKLKTAKDWVEKLANGINPLTLEPLKENEIVNNVHISRCLFFVREMLEKVEIRETASKKVKPFWMSTAEAEKIEVSVPCGVAQFTRIVNEHISEDMKPLSATTVIKWLRNNGYLFEYKKDAKHRTNLPTEKGLQLGITIMKQQSIEGQDYQKVVYDISAQRFMLSNMESIAVIS